MPLTALVGQGEQSWPVSWHLRDPFPQMTKMVMQGLDPMVMPSGPPSRPQLRICLCLLDRGVLDITRH